MNDDDTPAEVVPPGDSGGDRAGDPLAGLLGGGGLDLGSVMEMAANMQQQVADAQEELATARLEGTSGGGLVSVTLNGHLHLVALRVDPQAVDPDDPSMLEDLIRAAWQDAHDQVARLQAAADPLGGLGGGGLGSGGLGGLLGGS